MSTLAQHLLRRRWTNPSDGRTWFAAKLDRRGRVVLRDGNEFTVRWAAELQRWPAATEAQRDSQKAVPE